MKEDTAASKILKRIIKAEEMKQLFAKLRNIYKPKKSGGLSRLLVPDTINPEVDPKLWDADPTTQHLWKAVDLPAEILEALLKRNRRHFGQAHKTPFTVPPLSQAVDFSASTITSDLILEGDYTSSDLDAITALLVEHLQQTTQLDTVQTLSLIHTSAPTRPY